MMKFNMLKNQIRYNRLKKVNYWKLVEVVIEAVSASKDLMVYGVTHHKQC